MRGHESYMGFRCFVILQLHVCVVPYYCFSFLARKELKIWGSGARMRRTLLK
jgi:hypothetical protein